MHEHIKKNKIKTLVFWILACMVYLFFVYIFFQLFNLMFDVNIKSIFFIFIVLWFLLSIFVYFKGDSLLLKLSKAELAHKNIHPQLFNVVEELRIAANLKFTPKIYIIPSLSINAFSTGIRNNNNSIVLTAGLLSKLNRDELQVVIAHEMSHIINKDVHYLSFIGIISFIVTVIMFLIVYLLLTFVPLSFLKFDQYKGDIFAFIVYSILIIWGLKFMGLFNKPINFICKRFYHLLSNTREYLADAYAVKLTGNPIALASALEKIEIETNKLELANVITAPMYIESPMKKKDTHPAINKRIKVLKKMYNGTAYRDYQRAFNKVVSTSRLFSNVLLESEDREEVLSPKDIIYDEVMQEEDQANFFDCQCGVRIKIPSNFNEEKFCCPRCARIHNINDESFNSRHFNAINYIKNKKKLPIREVNCIQQDENNQLFYVLKNDEWESFLCKCGSIIQLAPSHTKDYVICKICKSKIKIKL